MSMNAKSSFEPAKTDVAALFSRHELVTVVIGVECTAFARSTNRPNNPIRSVPYVGRRRTRRGPIRTRQISRLAPPVIDFDTNRDGVTDSPRIRRSPGRSAFAHSGDRLAVATRTAPLLGFEDVPVA